MRFPSTSYRWECAQRSKLADRKRENRGGSRSKERGRIRQKCFLEKWGLEIFDFCLSLCWSRNSFCFLRQLRWSNRFPNLIWIFWEVPQCLSSERPTWWACRCSQDFGLKKIVTFLMKTTVLYYCSKRDYNMFSKY